MREWEYRKIALNQLSPKTADVDLLNDAGDKGWQLVAILPNNIAYLKREIEQAISETDELRWPRLFGQFFRFDEWILYRG